MLELTLSVLKKAIVFAVAFYFVALALLYFLQDNLVFPAPDVTGSGLLPGAEKQEMKAPDGIVLKHIRFPATEDSPKLMFFHGNGDAALFSQQIGRRFSTAGFDVLLAEYRGYGGSGGKPSAQKLLSDAVATYDWFAGDTNQPVFIFAHSLGTGVASYIAHQRPVKALVLASAYSALEDVAADKYPIFPVRTLFKNPIRSAEYLQSGSPPVMFFHGADDAVIPARFGKALFDVAGTEDKSWHELPGTGHNDIISDQLLEQAIGFFKNRR